MNVYEIAGVIYIIGFLWSTALAILLGADEPTEVRDYIILSLLVVFWPLSWAYVAYRYVVDTKKALRKL